MTTTSTTVTRFASDGQNVWADPNGSTALLMRRVYQDGVDQPAAGIDASGNAAWYEANRQGSVRDVVNYGGTMVLDHVDYDGYGNITNETAPTSGDRYKYTGRELDSETGLQYNRARYYDPRTGRWTSQDPIGFLAGDANLYRYVSNNPENGKDSNGLIGVFFDGTTFDQTNNGIIWQMYDRYGGFASYFVFRAVPTYLGTCLLGPFTEPLRSTAAADKEFLKQVTAALQWVGHVRSLPGHESEPVDIFGFSRGAMAAVVLSNRLAVNHIPVRFMGLIDPSASGTLYDFHSTSDTRTIPAGVAHVWIGLADARPAHVVDPPYVRLFIRHYTPSGGAAVQIVHFPSLEHWDAGSDPTVGADLWSAAFRAGAPVRDPEVQDPHPHVG